MTDHNFSSKEIKINFYETGLLMKDEDEPEFIHVELEETPWLKEYADSLGLPETRDFRINMARDAKANIDDEILLTVYGIDYGIDSVHFIPLTVNDQIAIRIAFEKQLKDYGWPSVSELLKLKED